MDSSFVIRTARSKFGSRTAVVDGTGSLTFEQLDERVDALAAGLLTAAVPGRPVASILGNGIDTLVLYLALARAGLVSVAINDRLSDAEIGFILDDCAAGTLVVDARQVPRLNAIQQAGGAAAEVFQVGVVATGGRSLNDLEDSWDGRTVDLNVDDRDDCSIVYSSGTSGFPKGVVRTHKANLWAVVNSFIGSPRTQGDVEMFVLPMFGIGFYFQIMPTLMAGGTVVLDDAFDAVRSWQLIERHGVTRAFVAPTMIAAMLDVPDNSRFDTSSIGVLAVAYEFAPELRDRAVERFGNVFINMYGLTEAQLCATDPGEFPASLAVGQAMGLARVLLVDGVGAEVPVGETGEIVFESPAAMTRYLHQPEATAATVHHDRVRTGDLGRLDEQGRLHFTGRLKEIVKSGGFNIDPVEVESVLLTYPGIREAALIGVPDERWGERAVAYVAAEPDIAPHLVIDHVRNQLAGFKTPKEIIVLDALPRNATGKIHRATLREAYRGGDVE